MQRSFAFSLAESARVALDDDAMIVEKNNRSYLALARHQKERVPVGKPKGPIASRNLIINNLNVIENQLELD